MAQFSGMWTTRQQLQAINNGTWPSVAMPIEFLLIAGGGGGATSYDSRAGAGAGGAGGYLSATDADVKAIKGATYTITVGAGGTSTTTGGPTNGENSVISGPNFTATTLGGGCGQAWTNGNNGGSGGGGGANVTYNNRGMGTAGQGYHGGGGGPWYGAGGAGGGAGGSAATTTFGPGVANSITGTSVTYARGGKYANESGTANTGNGGNTTGYGSGTDIKPGDSGVVIIRYLDTYPAATTTGSPTVTSSGGYRIYTFTGSGTITF